MSPDLFDLMTKDEAPAPCAVPGCNNPSLGGDIRGPGNVRVSQYCPLHANPVLLYGSLDRPSCLKGLPQYKEMIEISDSWMSAFPQAKRLPPDQCSEPAIANGLCIRHVAAGRDSDSTIVGARECIKMWRGRMSLANEAYTSDEAWRVLAEIDKIRRHGTSNSLIPRNTDSAMLAEMFAALFFEGPSLKQRVWLAFWMSPYSIGKSLDMNPKDVRYHLRHLADTGYVELDQAYELPQSLIVTHEILFPRKAYRAWRREKFRQKRPSWHMKVRIENLPKPNERVIEPVLDGPGIIDPDYQGQVLALTERGRAELRSWELKLANQEQQERRRRYELTLTIILIFLTSLLLVSAISDWPHALQVLRSWFTS
jgi:hypothetical protein